MNHRKTLQGARIVLLLCLAASVAAVFALTEQTVQETTSLSDAVVRFLHNMLLPFSAGWDHAVYVRVSWLVRKLAHTAEFFVVGLFAAAAGIAWTGDEGGRRFALWFSAIASLCDQFHKLFVPGREFDILDLVFDALGYLAAIRMIIELYRRFQSRNNRNA